MQDTDELMEQQLLHRSFSFIPLKKSRNIYTGYWIVTLMCPKSLVDKNTVIMFITINWQDLNWPLVSDFLKTKLLFVLHVICWTDVSENLFIKHFLVPDTVPLAEIQFFCNLEVRLLLILWNDLLMNKCFSKII